jgi:hypothetical protein
VVANSLGDVQRLVTARASLNARVSPDDTGKRNDDLTEPGSGRTLMHIAAIFGDEHMLDTLAKAGADIDRQSHDGRGGTALMEAMARGKPDNAQWLIRHGANINATTATGATVLVAAMSPCSGQDMVAQLLRAGALPNDYTLRIANKKGFDLRGDQPWRTLSREHAEVTADLDGDGTPDHARLLASADGRREGLFVQLSSQKPDRWIHASEGNALNTPAPPMQVTAAMPDSYKKDDKACDRAAARFGLHCLPLTSPKSQVLTLTRPGIRFAPKEGAVSIVHWDDKEQRFERTWIRD